MGGKEGRKTANRSARERKEFVTASVAAAVATAPAVVGVDYSYGLNRQRDR